ncbi:hypothetical protein [Streptomyces sp. NPDC056987]|uniref:hypothetical protein n=1 Tax=Streptomyces sp. NPDC056987 TaxID=3345988 RepID=UPI00363BBE3B
MLGTPLPVPPLAVPLSAVALLAVPLLSLPLSAVAPFAVPLLACALSARALFALGWARPLLVQPLRVLLFPVPLCGSLLVR